VHPVVWSPTAVGQLLAVRLYIQQFNPQAAEAVAVHLLSAGNGLEHFPHRGRPVTSMRELVANYRTIIRYRVARDGTVRIRNSSRRPTKP
jgi:plasmid stabilization system protein ParE